MNKKMTNFNIRKDEGIICHILYKLYRIDKPLLRKFILRFLWHYLGGGHQFYSRTLRKIFEEYHDIQVGMYSHGGCFIFGAMSPGVTIGRYCSIAVGVIRYNNNHPINIKSSHAFFFNSDLGYVEHDGDKKVKLNIGNDVWIGHGAIILAGCRNIGDGAVIGAGSVINKDIPPYSIAVGNPGRIILHRFSNQKIEELLTEKWWEKNINELVPVIDEFTKTIETKTDD